MNEQCQKLQLQVLRMTPQEREALEVSLRTNLPTKATEIAALMESTNDHFWYEDRVYRFYHQSFKVYDLQFQTKQIVELLKSLLPDVPLNDWFTEIVRQGTGKQFTFDDNRRWLETTRPILKAFFHAKYFLEMAHRYRSPPTEKYLPSGWPHCCICSIYGESEWQRASRERLILHLALRHMLQKPLDALLRHGGVLDTQNSQAG